MMACIISSKSHCWSFVLPNIFDINKTFFNFVKTSETLHTYSGTHKPVEYESLKIKLTVPVSCPKLNKSALINLLFIYNKLEV